LLKEFHRQNALQFLLFILLDDTKRIHFGTEFVLLFSVLITLITYEGGLRLTGTLFFLQKEYTCQNRQTLDFFSRYSPSTLTHFFHYPGKLLMPVAEEV
jgi:hypothetical protein